MNTEEPTPRYIILYLYGITDPNGISGAGALEAIYKYA